MCLVALYNYKDYKKNYFNYRILQTIRGKNFTVFAVIAKFFQ